MTPTLLPLLAALASASAPQPSLWDAALALEPQPAAAVARCDELREVLLGVAAGIRVDPASTALMAQLREATLDLDLAKLHGMLPEVDGAGRALYASGDTLGAAGYTYTLFPTAAERAAPRELLESSAVGRMEPRAHPFGAGQGFQAHAAGRLGTGKLRHERLAAAAERALQVLHARAVGPADPALLVAARRHQPQLEDPVELSVLGAFVEAAPELTDFLARFVVVERIGSLKEGALELAGSGRIDLEDLAASYPDLARFLERMDDVLRVDASLRHAQGPSLAEAALRSAWPGVAVRATTRDGALIPRDRAGPRPELAVRPTDARIDVTLVIDVETRVDGVLLRVTGIEIPIRYRSDAGVAAVTIELVKPPEVEVTGTSTWSTWFAELADGALNLEAQGDVVFRALSQGLDGRGTRGRATWSGGEVAGALDLLVVDNALVRFGTRLSGRYLAPGDAAVADALRLLSRSIRELDEDYVARRPALLAGPVGP